MIERRIKAARFPATKSLDSFDFAAIPSLNKMQVLELARCEWIDRCENVIAIGPSGTGKTHVALGLGLAACQADDPAPSSNEPAKTEMAMADAAAPATEATVSNRRQLGMCQVGIGA